MESHALHSPSFYKPKSFIEEVVKVYTYLAAVSELDMKFAILSQRAMKIRAIASPYFRNYLRTYGHLHGIEKRI